MARRRGLLYTSSVDLPLVIEDGLPILVLISPPKMTAAWIEAQREIVERTFARGQPYACVTYSGFVEELAGAEERKRLADWANEPRTCAVQKKLCVGSAVQLGSPLQRAFVTALHWMWKPVVPNASHATLEEAIEWAHARLVEAGVETPPLDMLKERILTPIDALHRAQGSMAAFR